MDITLTNITPNAGSILTSLLPIVSSVIVGLLNHFLKQLKKRKGDIWIKFLQSDKYISECIQHYNRTKFLDPGQHLKAETFGILSSFLLYFGILIVFKIFFGESWLAFSLSSLIIFLLAFYFTLIIDKQKLNQDLLRNSEHIAKSIVFFSWFVITGISNALFLNPFILNKTYPIQYPTLIYPTPLDWILFGTSFIFVILTIFYLLADRMYLLNQVKNLLNIKYSKQFIETFPKVHIKTKSIELEGKVFDIFDDNLITLENYGIKKAVEWDSITFMELKKYTQN